MKKTTVIKIRIQMVILVMPGIIINMIIIKLNSNENKKNRKALHQNNYNSN